MRPLIGIPCHAGTRAETDRPIYYNNRTYIHAVERAGGVPILIPILDDLSGLNVLLSRLDGLLLSGGIDVDPRYYREEPHPQLGVTNPQLDELELSLAHWALREDIPTLGICRGMQLLNVALGGNLYQDLDAEYPGCLRHPNWDLPRNQITHMVLIEPGSHMERVFGTRELPANSLHHQAIKEPGEGVYISGHSEDGVAEMLEVPAHRFMLAAQCHPEELYTEYTVWARLFNAFIKACSEAAIQPLEIVQPLGVAS
ncbi:MAG: gamma-glutamyl-gamma-aminobutyrate hydrolase family protein [Chloroflexi bacterium]|nr:gamma-glutamyl-gamma-aminobutyrate hydrolase family protein [Chloroflexota bacterium]